MTDRLRVKEHLRNEALYRPLYEPSLNREWKHRLLYQHTLRRQLKAALWERPHLLKRFVCIGVPILCMAVVFTWYFGFIQPERWFENIIPVLRFDVPPIGLKEVFLFVAIVNGFTFIIRKRAFVL
jgi:hypothetical protein